MIHQHILNFLGSIVGWIILWIILPNGILIFTQQSLETLTFKEIILFIVALLGLTGYLPMALVGIARSLRDMLSKGGS